MLKRLVFEGIGVQSVNDIVNTISTSDFFLDMFPDLEYNYSEDEDITYNDLPLLGTKEVEKVVDEIVSEEEAKAVLDYVDAIGKIEDPVAKDVITLLNGSEYDKKKNKFKKSNKKS